MEIRLNLQEAPRRLGGFPATAQGIERDDEQTVIEANQLWAVVEEAAAGGRHYLQIQPDFRISSYARRCPFRGAALETWLGHLRSAGLPD